MFRKTALAHFAALSLLMGVGCAKGIPVMGISEDGSVKEVKMDPKVFAEQMDPMFQSIHATTLPMLETKMEKASGQSKWKLNALSIGVGVVGAAGFGPLTWSFEPRFRLFISNRDDFFIP